MATTFNPEISNIVTSEGGTVIYNSGNILLVSEVSEELYRELLKSPYIESLENLPLKRYNITQKVDVPTLEIANTSAAFDDLSEDTTTDDENVSGGGDSGGGTSTGGGAN